MHEPRPVTPTRIIPAGAPLPARPPEPGESPPWRTPPPSPPPMVPPAPPSDPWPAAPPPGPVHVHVTVDLAPAEPEPEPSRRERLTTWLGRHVRPWHAVLGLSAAVVPIPGVGHSAATVWHYTVGLGREEFGAGQGYALGLVPLLLAVTIIVRRGGTPLRLFFLAVTAIGSLASFSWYDPVQILTGVAR
ncbi:hypothetical protein ACFVOB_22200 [Streptomyces rochei]|uniref:hypothetical protein n=1 Tax=Streptomyces rochei TaxID=1928 RepID=UPI0036B25CA3